EPGLADLVRQGIDAGRLSFADDPACVAGAEVVWVTFDTPVDEDDNADVAFVVEHVADLFGHLSDGALVVLSSQLPVGSVAALERGITFQSVRARARVLPRGVLAAVRSSNQAHLSWPARRLRELLGNLGGRRVCVLGLTYKPGTSTLRRSSAVETCRWLRS